MKRKIVSLILVLMLFPVASLFSACGKADGYNLDNLKSEYDAIALENGNIKQEEDGFVFDYSSHNKLETVISSTEPYVALESYNEVFYNLMSFANSYVDECSNNSATDNAEIKNKVQADLLELKKSVSDVNESVNIFAEVIAAASESEIKSDACLERFENLLKTYDEMFENAINFNNSLSNMYFNYVLKDGNPDVYSAGENNFNASTVINKLNSRIKYQVSNISECFVEMYFDGGKMAERIANSTKTSDLLDLDAMGYTAKINAIKVTLDVEVAADKANNEANKTNFYELSVQAQNIQTSFDNDREKFLTACNAIDFALLTEDMSKATPYETMCYAIILDYNDLVEEYNKVLTEMVKITASTGE